MSYYVQPRSDVGSIHQPERLQFEDDDYYYYVKAYAKSSGKTVYSSKSNVAKKKLVTALDIPKLNKVTGTIYNIDVSWAKVKNATEYWVYMQIGNGTPKLVKKVKGTSVVITGEDYDYAKTKCAVSVRAVYKKDGVMVVDKKAVKPVTATLTQSKYDGQEELEYLKRNVKNLTPKIGHFIHQSKEVGL